MAFVAPLLPALGSFFGSAAGIAATASTALGAFSSIQAGNYASAVAKNNARTAEENAARESVAAQNEAMRSDREHAALVADMLASQAGSGVSSRSRSSRQTRSLMRRVGRQSAVDISRAGADAAQRLKQDAANFRAEGKRARRQGFVDAFGQVLELGTQAGEFVDSRSSPSSLVTKSKTRGRFDSNLYGLGGFGPGSLR